MNETYVIVDVPAVKGRVLVRRVSDGKVARCKLSWLDPVKGETYQAKSRTKAIRMDGLDWTTEG